MCAGKEGEGGEERGWCSEVPTFLGDIQTILV